MLTKAHILTAIDTFVSRRPGLNPRNYDSLSSYRSEMRRVRQDHNDYLALRAHVAWCGGITAEHLLQACRSSFSGRLSIEEVTAKDGTPAAQVNYCTGQYFPTEYRRAACAVMASALWGYACNDMPAAISPEDQVRSKFRKEFGPRIQKRYFK